MDKETRNKLRYIVTQCRTILERAIGEILQGQFGIHHTGLVEDAESMTHLSADDREYREQIIVHFEHIKAAGFKPAGAVQQLIRETSFTHLNRLCAYKMMEVRDLIRTAVSKGIKSQGFMFYMADHPEDENIWKGGQQELAYRHFLLWLGGTFADEIPALFSPHDPANRLFPSQRVLDQVLELINGDELKDIWEQDETIGWIYQYFTPKELRDQARKDSPAPRNSYELAFRNQFYTPRYVVQFLTDNTLGRIWYEMCQGKTQLKEICRYLVCHPNEIFLGDGKTTPAQAASGEVPTEERLKQPVYILFRKIKDPREIRMLDPACGSMHFGLYTFELLEAIYEEAWDNHSDLLSDIRAKITAKTDFVKMVPGMILEHNIHGIDIDLRATQISALALWLRAQRSYQRLGLKREDRPRITKSNVVCAEPMPGEAKLLDDFVAELQPKALGEMLRQVFKKMSLAGEAGSLLKIEEEISRIVAETKKRAIEEQENAADRKGNVELFTTAEVKRLKGDRQEALDFTDITDDQFWDNAERKVIEALRTYTERAANGRGFLRRLFAEDAERGFAFVEICRERFDVVLMNPPFGELIDKRSGWITKDYKAQPTDLYCYFVVRAVTFLLEGGYIGCISSASFKTYVDYHAFRQSFFVSGKLRTFADLGWNVLDQAYVEACCYVLQQERNTGALVPFFDVRHAEEKNTVLLDAIRGTKPNLAFWKQPLVFSKLQDSPLIYWWSENRLQKLASLPRLGDLCEEIGKGAGPHAIFYRLRWEVPCDQLGLGRRWAPFANGGPYSPFRRDDSLLLEWASSGSAVKSYILKKYPYLNGNTEWNIQLESFYGRPGITYGKKTTNFSAQTLPAGFIFSFEGIGIFPKEKTHFDWLIAYLNSRFVSWFLNTTCGLHKNPPYLTKLPVPRFSQSDLEKLASLFLQGWNRQYENAILDERSPVFVAPFVSQNIRSLTAAPPSVADLNDLLTDIDATVLQSLSIDKSELQVDEQLPDGVDSESEEESDTANRDDFVRKVISYLVGCSVGRWDVRYAAGEFPFPEAPNPFAELPVCSPGTLTNNGGLPAPMPPTDYPIRVDVDGIVVDEPNHVDDITQRVREVLRVLWDENSEKMEHEICSLLGIEALRDYFRKPGNGGFWMDHVSRYSKSRRKAPIYWLLQSARKSYALWIYYHRLDHDTLNKALVNYVEPKLRLENNRLQELRGKITEVGTTGSAARDLDRKIERQEELISELNDFQDKLRRAADLHLEPDLNDGVVLNIAPLWELVPWKEAKKHWEELLEGEYEWSSIARQLKAKGLVKR